MKKKPSNYSSPSNTQKSQLSKQNSRLNKFHASLFEKKKKQTIANHKMRLKELGIQIQEINPPTTTSNDFSGPNVKAYKEKRAIDEFKMAAKTGKEGLFASSDELYLEPAKRYIKTALSKLANLTKSLNKKLLQLRSQYRKAPQKDSMVNKRLATTATKLINQYILALRMMKGKPYKKSTSPSFQKSIQKANQLTAKLNRSIDKLIKSVSNRLKNPLKFLKTNSQSKQKPENNK